MWVNLPPPSVFSKKFCPKYEKTSPRSPPPPCGTVKCHCPKSGKRGLFKYPPPCDCQKPWKVEETDQLSWRKWKWKVAPNSWNCSVLQSEWSPGTLQICGSDPKITVPHSLSWPPLKRTRQVSTIARCQDVNQEIVKMWWCDKKLFYMDPSPEVVDFIDTTGRWCLHSFMTGVNVIAVLKLLHLPLLHWTRALLQCSPIQVWTWLLCSSSSTCPSFTGRALSTVLSNTGVNVIAVLKLLHLPLLHWTRALYSALQYRCERDCCAQAPPPAPPSLDARSLQCSPIQVWTWLLCSSSSTCPSFTGRALSTVLSNTGVNVIAVLKLLHLPLLHWTRALYSALQYRCERDCCAQAPPPAPPSLDARSLQCSPIQVWTWLLCSSSSTCPSFTGRALSTVLSNTGVNVIAVLKLLHLPLLHWTRALYSALQYRCERDCCTQAPPPAPPSLDARSLQCSPIQV